MKLENKKVFMRRLGKASASPDTADAVAMALCPDSDIPSRLATAGDPLERSEEEVQEFSGCEPDWITFGGGDRRSLEEQFYGHEGIGGRFRVF